MKITGHEVLRQSAFVVLLVGLVAGSWHFVFRPRDVEEGRMRVQIDAKQEQLQKLNRATATLGDLREEIRELEKAIDFFHSKLPSEKEIDKVLEEVWRLAEANHLLTKGIYTTKRTASSLFLAEDASQTEQPIRMEFEGDFLDRDDDVGRPQIFFYGDACVAVLLICEDPDGRGLHPEVPGSRGLERSQISGHQRHPALPLVLIFPTDSDRHGHHAPGPSRAGKFVHGRKLGAPGTQPLRIS